MFLLLLLIFLIHLMLQKKDKIVFLSFIYHSNLYKKYLNDILYYFKVFLKENVEYSRWIFIILSIIIFLFAYFSFE